jgi:hypothetical protein
MINLMSNPLDHKAAGYQVYVMRIWLEKVDSPVWRFSLEDPNTGQRKGFACLSKLTAYLENATTLQPIDDKLLQG